MTTPTPNWTLRYNIKGQAGFAGTAREFFINKKNADYRCDELNANPNYEAKVFEYDNVRDCSHVGTFRKGTLETPEEMIRDLLLEGNPYSQMAAEWIEAYVKSRVVTSYDLMKIIGDAGQPGWKMYVPYLNSEKGDYTRVKIDGSYDLDKVAKILNGEE